MAQPNKASDTNSDNQDIKQKQSSESADQTNTSGSSIKSMNTKKPDTTAVVTQVTNDKGVAVNADSIPTDANQETDPATDGDDTTNSDTASSTDASSGDMDQPIDSGTSSDQSNEDQPSEGDDNESSANNGVPPPDLSDPKGLELSINELPNFDVYCTRCELLDAFDKAISRATESSNSRELLLLNRIKTYYFNVLSVKSLCDLILQLHLGVELPVTLKQITQGVR